MGDPRTAVHRRASMSVPGDLIDLVKPIADEDGMTVASWIRYVARQEAQRRTGVVIHNGPVDLSTLQREMRRSENGSSSATGERS